MSYNVTSWFVDQCSNHITEPKRVFNIGASDYSGYVDKWPKIKRTSDEIKATTVTIPLINTDGHLNRFYENAYTTQQCCTLQMGFTHPESGDELITLYTGNLKKVKYSGSICNVILKDKLWEFTQRKIGDTSSGGTVTLSEQIPSDIFWTISTCYGELDATQDSSNPDIFWPDFEAWAGQFSADSITNEAFYDGQKVTEALQSLATMNDSSVWTDGLGRVRVAKFGEPSSLDIVITIEERNNLEIDVDALRLVNQQNVFYNYSVASDYWQNTLVEVNTASVNSYGTHEGVLQSENIWFVNSASASNLADRKITRLKDPPKTFDITTTLFALYRQIGETLRIVDDFWNITSESGWRITETSIDMSGAMMIHVDETATAGAGFFLDISRYNSDDRLL